MWPYHSITLTFRRKIRLAPSSCKISASPSRTGVARLSFFQLLNGGHPSMKEPLYEEAKFMVLHRLCRLIHGLVLAIVCLLRPAVADNLTLDITQGQTNPIPIAIPAFLGTQPVGANISSVIESDLNSSGLFRSMNPAAFIQTFTSVGEAPRFPDWRAIGTQLLVVGEVQPSGAGQLRVDFRLYDILSQQQMIGFSYQTTPDNWRRIAHIIADAIYERVTGEKGYFDSRIVYVAESGDRRKTVKRLAVMDQDGANNRYLTDGAALVLTPRFSPSEPLITYLAYYNNKPRVYTMNIDSGKVQVLGDFPGMTFAPRFSPNGRKVIFSYVQAGNTDIYTMDLGSRTLARLTTDPGIDTSADYSPDGSRIVFNSDRGGTQQLYVMSAGGGTASRISFGEGRYGTPVWSPRGDLIAFTKSQGGQFYIGVMRTDGSGERLLSGSYLDEGPTWSPNGRVLAFFRETPAWGSSGQGQTSRLQAIDLTGYNARTLKTPGDASDPAWSRLNPN
jgi:TolB protein